MFRAKQVVIRIKAANINYLREYVQISRLELNHCAYAIASNNYYLHTFNIDIMLPISFSRN